MKKISLSLILLGTVVASYAIPSAAPTVAANRYVTSTTQFVAKTAGFDTLAGVDSSTLASQISIPNGSEFTLLRGPMTNVSTSDSVKVIFYVDSYINNTFCMRTPVDTMLTIAGEQISIPFWSTIFGDKFTIKLVSFTGNGAKVALPAIKLYVRKLYVENKPVNIN